MSTRKQISFIGGYIDPGFDRTDRGLSGHVADPDRQIATVCRAARDTCRIARDPDRFRALSIFPITCGSGAELLSQCPNVLVVSASGAGFDAIDVAACTQAGVIAVNQTGGNREAVGEHTLGMMLALTKRIGEVDKALRTGEIVDRIGYMGDDLYGKTVGIVGFGNTGTRVAELCSGLFAMTVLAYDPYVGANAITARNARKVRIVRAVADVGFRIAALPAHGGNHGHDRRSRISRR